MVWPTLKKSHAYCIGLMTPHAYCNLNSKLTGPKAANKVDQTFYWYWVIQENINMLLNLFFVRYDFIMMNYMINKFLSYFIQYYISCPYWYLHQSQSEIEPIHKHKDSIDVLRCSAATYFCSIIFFSSLQLLCIFSLQANAKPY